MKLESIKNTRRFEAQELQALAEKSHPLYEERLRARCVLERRRWLLRLVGYSAAGFLVGALLVVIVRTDQVLARARELGLLP